MASKAERMKMKAKLNPIPAPDPDELPGQYSMFDKSEQAPAPDPGTPTPPEAEPAPAENIPKNKKAEPAPVAKEKGKPFSIWLDGETKKELKAYATATDRSMSEIVSTALHAHFKRIKLSDAEKIIYDAMMSK